MVAAATEMGANSAATVSVRMASEVTSTRFTVSSLMISIGLVIGHPGCAAWKTLNLGEVVALMFAGLGG